MISLALKGAKGRNWYKYERDFWMQYAPIPWRRALGVIAATSPRQSVDRNVDMALRIMHGWPVRMMKSHRLNVERAMRGERLSGPKVSNFHDALLGDPNAVVVDRRMLRAAGYAIDDDSITTYRAVADEVRDVAEELGWEPAETQAAIWCAMPSRGTNLPPRVLARKWWRQWLPGFGPLEVSIR